MTQQELSVSINSNSIDNNESFICKYWPHTISGGKSDGHDCPGYCHFECHRGYLLGKQMEDHQCLEKHCHYFEQNTHADYYKIKAFAKEKRCIAKTFKKLWSQSVISPDLYISACEELKDVRQAHQLQAFYSRYKFYITPEEISQKLS